MARARRHEPGEGLAAAPQARYELRQSASFAFLLALEALTPPQRAVLLLRDVLDYSVRETADALGLSTVNVKVIHHRARRAMAQYDRENRPVAEEAHICGEARRCGEYHAALRPVIGADRIQRFFFGLLKKLGARVRFDVRRLNGLPAVVAEYDEPAAGWGPRFVMRCDVDPHGAIREVHIVVASRKLSHVAPVP